MNGHHRLWFAAGSALGLLLLVGVSTTSHPGPAAQLEAPTRTLSRPVAASPRPIAASPPRHAAGQVRRTPEPAARAEGAAGQRAGAGRATARSSARRTVADPLTPKQRLLHLLVETHEPALQIRALYRLGNGHTIQAEDAAALVPLLSPGTDERVLSRALWVLGMAERAGYPLEDVAELYRRTRSARVRQAVLDSICNQFELDGHREAAAMIS